MSLRITATLTCDGCGQEELNWRGKPDLLTAEAELSLRAKNNGWAFELGGRYCPRCKSNRIDPEVKGNR